MYYVAKVDASKCAEYKCDVCTMHCPEPNTLMVDGKVSWVDEERCKGCALCVYVCSDMLKRDCITMEMPEKKEA